MKKKIEEIIGSCVLKDNVTVKVANVTKYNDYQVEIREEPSGHLFWRAWTFEQGFEHELKENLEQYAIKK